MPLAHVVHHFLVATPAALSIALVALVIRSSVREARRRGEAEMRDSDP